MMCEVIYGLLEITGLVTINLILIANLWKIIDWLIVNFD